MRSLAVHNAAIARLVAFLLSKPCPQELDLSGCESLTDVGVIAVAENCARLEVLRLASCQRLTDCTFVALGSFCSRLKAISACGCGNLSDLGITCLAQGARYCLTAPFA